MPFLKPQGKSSMSKYSDAELHMRKSNDTRNDAIVKYEILKELTKKYYIEGIYDDRARVVKMAREAGFRVYQVNYGNF